MVKRKANKKIVDDLVNVLRDGTRHNADEIARLSGVSWQAVINWFDLIAHIQSLPQVSRERLGRINIYWIPFEETRKR